MADKISINEIHETGLVFGFDMGTASLAHAVCKGDALLDVGVQK
jgi:hypothetical protein